MRARVVRIDREHPQAEVLAEAAAVLAQGGLVAFPTETVYGLGADARDAGAVAAIFRAKGRPSSNPIIVHVADVEAARALAPGFTPLAERLAAAFWPGPLTLVVPRGPRVPDIVTAGGDTVALRSPSHPVARALLRRFGGPVAAPSANRSTEISPTTAAHVERSLGDRIPLILDGGPTDVGLESTVVDATGERARILRPGTITRTQLEALGPLDDSPLVASGPARSPGLLERHYAPRASLVLVDAPDLQEHQTALHLLGRRVATLLREDRDAATYAATLYARLHALDDGADVILVERPPAGDVWEAIHDRLRRASTPATGD